MIILEAANLNGTQARGIHAEMRRNDQDLVLHALNSLDIRKTRLTGHVFFVPTLVRRLEGTNRRKFSRASIVGAVLFFTAVVGSYFVLLSWIQCVGFSWVNASIFCGLFIACVVITILVHHHVMIAVLKAYPEIQRIAHRLNNRRAQD